MVSTLFWFVCTLTPVRASRAMQVLCCLFHGVHFAEQRFGFGFAPTRAASTRTNVNPPLHPPRVAAGRRRRRRPFQTEVTFGAGLIRPRHARHVAHSSRGTHPGDRHAFIRAVETHRAAQARACPAVWLVCPERAEGEVSVRVPGAEGPLLVSREVGSGDEKRGIGHFAGIMHALTGWILTFLRVDDGLTVQTKLLHDGIPLYLGTGKDGRRIGPHAETPARACLLHRVRNPIGGEIQAVVGHFHEESLAISV